MAQKLILPINNTKLTASWKTDAYKSKFGFVHYGADVVSTVGIGTLYASGDGEVVATGTDNVVGNVIAVKYTQATNSLTGKVQDVIFRYFHLSSIAVKKGTKVTKDTKLGVYGNTGSLSMAAHLHLEADTDTAHPLYSPTVKSSNLIRGWGAPYYANDKTMTNPLEWLYCKPTAPDNQTYTTANDSYIRAEDKAIASTATRSPEEITVDNAISAGAIPVGDKAPWLQVLRGEVNVSAPMLKAVLDAYHSKIK